MNRREQEELLKLLEEKAKREKYNKIDYLYPLEGPYRRELYPKHTAFANSTQFNHICVFMAGNRTGKSMMGCMLVEFIASGLAPEWYTGRQWKRPVTILVVGKSTTSTRDVLQKELLGEFGDPGSGLIPKHLIVENSIRPKPGTPNGIEMLLIKHHTDGLYDGNSIIYFKSYEQSPDSLMGMKIDVILYDEEPPMDYYGQGLKRTMISDPGKVGLNLLTFTPENGFSDVVLSFLEEGQFKKSDKQGVYLTTCSWDDVPHLTKEQKDAMWDSLPPHMREASKTGIPVVGSGAIYPFPISQITCEPFSIPDHWPKCIGLDVGNNTAAVWGAYDTENDTWYITGEYKSDNASIVIHASALKKAGDWIPIVVDPASSVRAERSLKDGKSFIQLYGEQNLTIYPADNSVETGIMNCYTRFESGRLKIFSTCSETIAELRFYRREVKNNSLQIVKTHDHLMDSMRYLCKTGLYVCKSKYELQEDPEYIRNKILNSRNRNPITGY